MLIKNITYKGYNLGVGNEYNILIDGNNKNSQLRTTIFDKENFHGANSTRTLGSGRLFTFSGKIYGASYEERQVGVNLLNSIIQPEGLPTDTNQGFYQLTFEDWNGTKYKVDAKVYSEVQFTHEVNNPIIEFTFELYSEQYWYYGYLDKTVNAGFNEIITGTVFPIVFPFVLGGIGNAIQIVNNGNFYAPCLIRIQGTIENPRIVNNDTETNYRLSYTTNDLIIDNRGKNLIVTDEGVDITKYRDNGSVSIFLKPGINNIFIFGDNPDPDINITFEFNDTYTGG